MSQENSGSGRSVAMLPHDISVELKEFRRAVKAFVGRKAVLGSTLLSVEHGFLIIESGEVRVVMRAEGEWHGRVRFSPEVLRAVATVPPSENPVRIRYADGKVRIGTMMIPCDWQALSNPLMEKVINPDLLDLLAMGANLSRTELAGSPLGLRVQEAESERDKRLRKAARELSVLGISEATLLSLVAEAVRSRANAANG